MIFVKYFGRKMPISQAVQLATEHLRQFLGFECVQISTYIRNDSIYMQRPRHVCKTEAYIPASVANSLTAAMSMRYISRIVSLSIYMETASLFKIEILSFYGIEGIEEFLRNTNDMQFT